MVNHDAFLSPNPIAEIALLFGPKYGIWRDARKSSALAPDDATSGVNRGAETKETPRRRIPHGGRRQVRSRTTLTTAQKKIFTFFQESRIANGDEKSSEVPMAERRCRYINVLSSEDQRWITTIGGRIRRGS